MPTPPTPKHRYHTVISSARILFLLIGISLIFLKYYADTYDNTIETLNSYIYIVLIAILVCEIILVKIMADQLAAVSKSLAKLQESQTVDGCYTGDALTSMVEREVARAGRAGRALAILMIDVANQANPTSADERAELRTAVVREMTNLIRTSTRTTDVLGQFQPGELALLLPDTPTDHATIVAAKLRKRLDDATAVPDAGRLNVKLVTARQAEDGTGIVWRFDEILEASVVQTAG